MSARSAADRRRPQSPPSSGPTMSPGAYPESRENERLIDSTRPSPSIRQIPSSASSRAARSSRTCSSRRATAASDVLAAGVRISRTEPPGALKTSAPLHDASPRAAPAMTCRARGPSSRTGGRISATICAREVTFSYRENPVPTVEIPKVSELPFEHGRAGRPRGPPSAAPGSKKLGRALPHRGALIMLRRFPDERHRRLSQPPEKGLRALVAAIARERPDRPLDEVRIRP